MERGTQLVPEQRSPNPTSALLSFISLQFILEENGLLLGWIPQFPGAPELAAWLGGEEGLIGGCWRVPRDAGASVVPLRAASILGSRAEPGFAPRTPPGLCTWCRGHRGWRWQQGQHRSGLRSGSWLQG